MLFRSYGDNRIVMIGDSSAGVSAQAVASHEYGHHVALNRVNAPWPAEDWGTKRWASAVNVCSRVAAGTAFPGDESDHYTLNPGEAFAETYRALNESKAGATSFQWLVVDASFFPDPSALQAVEQDVVQPWVAPTTQILAGRFVPRGRSVWTLPLATPLDGNQIGRAHV